MAFPDTTTRLALLTLAVAMPALRPAPVAARTPVPLERLVLASPAHAKASRHARRRPYKVTAYGFATSRQRLLVFLDYDRCAPDPAGERAHGAPWVGYLVSGGFMRSSTWESGVARMDHACAYLVDPKQPDVVLARRAAAFRIHRG